jgi:hypothetical protein
MGTQMFPVLLIPIESDSGHPPYCTATYIRGMRQPIVRLSATQLAREAEAPEPENAAAGETGVAKRAVSSSHIARTSSDHNQV